MHRINKNRTKRSEAASTLWDKLLELLGLPTLEPVPIKIFEKKAEQLCSAQPTWS